MNKALFLSDPTVSHTFDTFYHGMCQVLGNELVHDYPCYPKYHTNHKVPGDKYSWWCYTENTHVLSLTLEGWAQEVNEGKIKYIFFTNRGNGPKHLFKLLSLIRNDILPSIYITFIEEEHDLDFSHHRHNVAQLRPIWNKIDLYYRMDYVKENVVNDSKVYPLYIGMPENKMMAELDGGIKDFDMKKYDVCYMVGNSHPNRKKYYDILKAANLPGCNIIEFGDHKYGIKDYFNIINDSKIFISVRGAEYHNTRNIEGPYLGAALFSERLPTTVPFDYTHGESCIYFDESNLVSQLLEYLNNPVALKKLADNGKNHCHAYHTTAARAKQFFDTIKNLKRGGA